ncbi:MAG: selenobiotic family radical SAM modification target peptide [Deltaproteobacteria bacterium]|nr:selenobiotic family radical SAM modification target peptide [Deltaproteobacteria bacterium]
MEGKPLKKLLAGLCIAGLVGGAGAGLSGCANGLSG